MMTLEEALARLAIEEPRAAAAARAYLDNTQEKNSIVIHTRISPRLRSQLQAAQQAHGLSESEMYRYILEGFLNGGEA